MKPLLSVLLIVFTISFITNAQEATQWRGKNSSGIYTAEKLLAQWPADGPRVIWSFDKLGQGYSSPAFANNKIYVNGMVGDQAVLFVLDMNGKLLQQFKYGKEFVESYPGVRSTPTIVGDMAYLLTGHGVLTCLNLKTGKPAWQKDFINNFGGSNITWGYTESIMIDGDVLYCTPGGKKNNVMALNRLTGETVWSCEGLGEVSAYCTPLLVKPGAIKLLITHTADHVLGIDASSGKLLWNFEHKNQWDVHPNTPVYNDGGIFVFSGYGQGGEKLKLVADGNFITKEWEMKSFDNRIGGAVYIDGYLYGSGDNDRSWQCIDWKTGKKMYSSTEMGKGVVIGVNNKLIGYSERGELFYADANPSGLKLISKTRVTLGSEQHWAHPVVFNGVLYVRHGNTLIAYQISE